MVEFWASEKCNGAIHLGESCAIVLTARVESLISSIDWNQKMRSIVHARQFSNDAKIPIEYPFL